MDKLLFRIPKQYLLHQQDLSKKHSSNKHASAAISQSFEAPLLSPTIARPLLCILTVHLDFMTVLTYMRGIKITTNILIKYLE
jgi:hypothetical protein